MDNRSVPGEGQGSSLSLPSSFTQFFGVSSLTPPNPISASPQSLPTPHYFQPPSCLLWSLVSGMSLHFYLTQFKKNFF